MRKCTVSKLNFPGTLEERIDRVVGDFDSSIKAKMFIAGMLNTEEFRNNFIKSLGKKEREKVANLICHNPLKEDVTLELLDKIDKAIFTRIVKKLFKDKSRNVSLYTKKDEIDRKGFSSGEALQLAEIEHGRIIKRIYDENSKLPVEERLSTEQIIRKAAAEITNIFYRDNVNTLIESNIQRILQELGASEQSLFGDLQTLIDKLKEVKDDPKYSALYQYLTIDERLKEIRDKFVNEKDDEVAERLKDEFKALNNQKFIYAQNIINKLATENTRTNTIIKNWSNLAQLARSNDAEWNVLVTTHPTFFSLAKIFNKGFERLEELDEEEFENSVDDEGYDRDTMMRNYGEKEVRNFQSYFSDEIKEYLSTIPRLREYWDLNSEEAKYDRDNELGVQTYYKREFVMQQLLSFANTNSMNEFITSIESKAKSVPQLYGLSKIARDIRNNRVLRNALFRSCATFNITKAMVFVKNSNYGVSNRNNQNRTIIHYNLNNQFRQTYSQPATDEFRGAVEAISEYRVDEFINGQSELIETLLESYCKYFPNINITSIENYINSSTNNNIKINRIKKLGQNLLALIDIADDINSYREEQINLYNGARAAYVKYQHERNEHELNPLLYDAPRTDELTFYGVKITEIDGKEVVSKPEYFDFIDQDKINSMIGSSDKIVAELANIIDFNGTSSAEHNSSNAEANMSSDLIKPNYVTRFFEMLNYNPSDDTPLEKNEALLALKDKITKGDKNSNQYTYHPILFGFDVAGVHVPGIFKRVGNEIVIDEHAKDILQLQYFNGVTNPDNNVAQLYNKLGINDYFITSFVAYISSIPYQNQNGQYTTELQSDGQSYTRAQYFLRTPSDKPNNLTIGYFALNREQCLASITMNVKQELCDFITQLGNVLEKSGDDYYIKENGSSTNGLFARQHFEDSFDGAKFIDDNGRLAGNFFKFHKLFEVNGYNANDELMQQLSLYGEGLIIKDGNGRYKLNRNFIGKLLTLNEADSKIRTSFINNEAIDEIISDIVSEWSRNFFIDVFNNHEDMIASLGNLSNMDLNDRIIEDFLLNNVNMNMNYDMLFEGNVGFYKDTRDFLKRTKEVQAGGLAYAGFATTDRNFEGLKEINDINGSPEVIEIKTKRDGQVTSYSIPTNNGNFIGNRPITARNGFRAVTVKNVIRKSSRIADLTKQMKDIYVSQGIDEDTASKMAKQALSGLNPKFGTKVDDAQSYITFEEWIRRRYADGTLDQYQDLIGMLLDPNVKVEDLDLAAINARIQVDKNFYYDMMYDDETRTYYPRQIKNAEFVLIPKLLPEGSELRNIYEIMKAHDIGQLNTSETSKAAKKNVLQLWNEDGTIVDTFENEIDNASEVYYYRYLYKQQDNPEHIRDKENKAGIQIMSKILDNSDLSNDVIKNAVKKFFNNYSENIHQAFVEFIDSCGWVVKDGVIVNKTNGSTKLDYSRFIMAARQEAARLGLNTEQLKYFDIDEKGNFRLPIGMNILGDKIENTLMSLINSNITRQTLPGFHGVQITNVGYDESLQYHPRAYLKDGKYIKKEDYDKLEDKTGWEETNAPYIEIRLPRWSDKIPKHSENLSDDEILKMLEDAGLDQMIIYRIPTEGKQSIAVAKVVGFVEEIYGSTIVVPDEWVTQTGSDFDTDSIYGITYEMYVDRNGKPRKIEGVKNNVTEEELKRHYVRYINSKLEHRINRAQYTDGELEKQLKRQYKEVKEKLADSGTTFKEINDIVFDLEGILPGRYKAILKENRAIAKDIAENKLDKLLTSISLIYGEMEEQLQKEKDEATKVLVRGYLDNLNDLNALLNSQTELIRQKSDISSKIEQLKQKREELFSSQFDSVEKAAKVLDLPTFEEYKNLSREEQNTTPARNNQILDAMIEIMSSPLSLEENLSTSNFINLGAANKKCKEILGIDDAKLSPYNPIDQMLQHGDAMGGADLKGISVNFDSLCSLCNFTKAELTKDKLELPEFQDAIEVLENIGVEVVYPSDYDKEAILAAYPNAKPDKNGNIIVFHDQVGHSANNKNVVGKYITVYSSETTAHALDAIKEGSILNLDPYNFPEYKILSMIGIDYDTILSFLYQPAVSKVMEIKRANDSIYNQSSTNPIQQAIIQLVKARYPDNPRIQHSYSFFNILREIGINKQQLANYNIRLDSKKQFERLSRPGDITRRLTEHYNKHLLIGQGNYAERTRMNVDWSDITLALASNFDTAGEVATARFAGAVLVDTGRTNNRGRKLQKIATDGGKYVSNVIQINNPEATANDLYNRIINQGLPTTDIKLNIAGNGIYTLKRYGFTQEQINDYVTEVIRLLQEKGITIREIRSGGQSGIDEAGIIAAQRLGLEYSILMPEDYSYKTENNITVKGRKESLARFGLEDGTMSKQVEEDYNTDLDILLSFYRLHSIGAKVNNLLQKTKPDKFGAKQTMFETLEMLDEIDDLISPAYFDSSVTGLDRDVQTFYNSVLSVRLNKEDNDDKFIFNGVEIDKSHVSLLLKLYQFNQEDEYDINEIKEISAYPYKAAFLKYTTMLSERVVRPLLVYENEEFFDTFKGAVQTKLGRKINNEEWKKLKRYTTTLAYSRIPQLTHSSSIDLTTGNIKIDLNSSEEKEINRINGYISTNEEINLESLDNPFLDENSSEEDKQKYKEALDIYYSYTPIQKVQFLQKTLRENRGIFEYINSILFNQVRYDKYGYSGAKMSFNDGDVNLEDLFVQFNQAYHSENPFIKSAAIDLVKYVFLVEGQRFRRGNISKFITDDAISDENGLDISRNFNKILFDILLNKNDQAVLNFIRSNPTIAKQVKISEKTRKYGQWQVTPAHTAWNQYGKKRGGIRLILDTRENEAMGFPVDGDSESKAMNELLDKLNPHDGEVLYITEKSGDEYVSKLYLVNYIPALSQWAFIPIPKLDNNEVWNYSYNGENNEGYYPIEDYLAILDEYTEKGKEYDSNEKQTVDQRYNAISSIYNTIADDKNITTIPKIQSINISNIESNINYFEEELEKNEDKFLVGGIEELKRQIFDIDYGLLSEDNLNGVLYVYNTNYKLRNVVSSTPSVQRLSYTDEFGEEKEIYVSIQLMKSPDRRNITDPNSITKYDSLTEAPLPNSTYKITLLGANRETKPKFQDTIELNDLKEYDSPANFNDVETSVEVLNSQKTILSNSELSYWNSQGINGFPRILVASEHTDPAFHVNELLDTLNGKRKVKDKLGREFTGHDFAGLYIVTKHDGLPMLKLLKTPIPKLVHFSVTSLGDTQFETGVMKYNDMLDRIEDYLRQGLDPDCVTIRIDPIVPGVTDFKDVENIIRRSKAMGINRIKFSVMDVYPDSKRMNGTVKQFDINNVSYDFNEYYGSYNPQTDGRTYRRYDAKTGIFFNAKQQYIDEICEFMVKMKEKYDVEIHTCAETVPQRYIDRGIQKDGCLSVSAVNKMLGTHIEDKAEGNNKQRAKCTCFGGKVDAFTYNDKCISHCIYCYADQQTNATMQYYNPDGTLKVNAFTKTREYVPRVFKYQGKWTRQSVDNDRGTLYIFTDNTDRSSGKNLIPDDSWYAKKYGKGHHYPNTTQAVIRGLDNARPISTQRWYHTGATYEKGNWHDSDIEEFMRVINEEIQDIIEEWNTGKYQRVMIGDGDAILNGSISNITKERTPELYKFLSERLSYLFNYINGIYQEESINKENNSEIEEVNNTEIDYNITAIDRTESGEEIEIGMSSGFIRPIMGNTYSKSVTLGFEESTAEMVTRLYQAAAKGDQRAKDLKILFYKTRINTGSMDNMADNAKYIYEKISDYISAVADELIDKSKNFELNGTIYSIDDEELYRNLGDFNDYLEFQKYNELVKLLLDITTFGSYLADLRDIPSNDELNRSIHKIRETINKVKTETKVKDAFENIFNIYFAKYSSNPLVSEGIIQLREEFGDADWFDHWFADVSHLRNKEVQVVVKLVNSMLNEVNRYLAPKARRAFYKKYDDIMAMPGTCDFTKFIDEYNYLRHDYTKDFIDKKQELDDKVNDALNIYGRYSTEYMDAWIEREEFLIKNVNREIDTAYYKDVLDNIKEIYRDAPDLYFEYTRLSHELNDETLKFAEGTPEELERKRKIRYDISQLTNKFNVYTNTFKTGAGLIAIEKLSKFLDRKREINEYYFNSDEVDNWEDNLNNYISILNTIDAANPDMTIEEKCSAFQDYNEAYNWIKINAHRKMTDEAEEKINEAREVLEKDQSETIAYRSTIKHYAHQHGQLDINNGIDARMFTDDEIRSIKQAQIDAFDEYVEDPSDLDREGLIVDERSLSQPSQSDIDYLRAIKPDIPTEAQEIRRRVYLELNKYLRPYFKSNGEFDDIKFVKELSTDDYLEIKNLLAELDNLPKTDESHPQYDAWLNYWKAFYYDEVDNPDGIYEGKTDDRLFNQKRARALTELSGQELTFWRGIFAYITTDPVTGVRITSPSPVFFDYLEVATPHIDTRRTWAIKTLNDNTESIGNEYFQDALKKARKEGREQEFLKLNTVYNRNTHKWELLRIWTTTELKPGNPLGGSYEYIPTFENKKSEIKPAFNNELRGVFHREEINYNTATGEYNDNFITTLNDKEKAMRQLFIDTMNEYLGINYKIDSAINSGILPRETINPWNTQRVLNEAGQMVGFKLDQSYNEYSMEGQLSYVKDTTENLNLMDIQKVKGFEIEEAIPPRNNGESMLDYYNRIKEIREKNREKRQRNLDREKDLLNKDYRSVFGKFVTAATEARAKEEIKGTIYLLLEELLNNEAYDINSKGKVTRNAARSTIDSVSYNKKKQLNTYDVVQNWAKRKLFNDYQDKNWLRSAANVTQMFTSAKFMIGNIYSGIANVTTGYTNMTMELFSEDYFTRKDAMEAQVEYLSGTASYLGVFMNVAEQEKYATKQDAIIKLCNVIEYDKIFERAPGEKLSAYNERCRDALYGFQSMGEHLMQNTVLFALLKGTRIYYDPITKMKRLVSEKQFSRHLEMEALRLVLDEVNPDFRTNFEEFIENISNDKKLLRKYDNFSKDVTQEWLKSAFFNENAAVTTAEAKDILEKFTQKRKELMESRKNEFYNLKRVYDQLDFVDGNIELIENDDNDSFDGRLLGELIERVIMLNKKIHGVYDKDGAARIERTWFGSLIMQYHKHIYPGCMKHWRFRGGYFNETRQTIERGMYADGIRYLANILPFYDNFVKARDGGASVIHSILNSAMHTVLELPLRVKLEAITMPKHRIDNMKRIWGEGAAIVTSALAFLVIYSMYGGDDDDKERLKNDVIASSALYLADRLISETIMYNGYGTVMEAKTLWNNPIAGGAFYIDVIDAASLATEYMFGLNPDWEPVYQRGPHKGENKFAVLAKRNFWLTRIYNRINTIGQNNAYYRIGNKSIVSDIAKSIAWEDDEDTIENTIDKIDYDDEE